MVERDKPLLWLHGEIATPPFSQDARIEAGTRLRQLQRGEMLHMPHARPMPTIGARCHELRVQDERHTWRIMYHVAPDAVVILEVFSKKSNRTPQAVLEACRRRLREYLAAAGE